MLLPAGTALTALLNLLFELSDDSGSPFKIYENEGSVEAAEALYRWLEFNVNGFGCGDERGPVTDFESLNRGSPPLPPPHVATDEQVKEFTDFLYRSVGVARIDE